MKRFDLAILGTVMAAIKLGSELPIELYRGLPQGRTYRFIKHRSQKKKRILAKRGG